MVWFGHLEFDFLLLFGYRLIQVLVICPKSETIRLAESPEEAAQMVRITKEVAQRILADVPDEKRFWLADGRYLKNLDELEAALVQLSPEVFKAHCNEAKSDFSNWVKDVMGDDELASNLSKCTTREQAARAVSGRIQYLKRRAA
jgi:hypothetical protein